MALKEQEACVGPRAAVAGACLGCVPIQTIAWWSPFLWAGAQMLEESLGSVWVRTFNGVIPEPCMEQRP